MLMMKQLSPDLSSVFRSQELEDSYSIATDTSLHCAVRFQDCERRDCVVVCSDSSCTDETNQTLQVFDLSTKIKKAQYQSPEPVVLLLACSWVSY